MNQFFVILSIIAYIVGFIGYYNAATNKIYNMYYMSTSKRIIVSTAIGIFWPLLFIVDSFSFIIRVMGRLTGIK